MELESNRVMAEDWRRGGGAADPVLGSSRSGPHPRGIASVGVGSWWLLRLVARSSLLCELCVFV